MPTIVITSGYFNPIHPGHIECFELAKKLGDELWVIVNNDLQAELKRGEKSFQDQELRMRVAGAIKPVDRVFLSIDKEASVCDSLEFLIQEVLANNPETKIIFAKGGDRFADNTAELPICTKYNVELVSGLGAKTHNSSDFLKKIKTV